MGNIASWGSCSQQYKNLEQNDDIAISTKDSLCNHYFQFEQGITTITTKDSLYTVIIIFSLSREWLFILKKIPFIHGCYMLLKFG